MDVVDWGERAGLVEAVAGGGPRALVSAAVVEVPLENGIFSKDGQHPNKRERRRRIMGSVSRHEGDVRRHDFFLKRIKKESVANVHHGAEEPPRVQDRVCSGRARSSSPTRACDPSARALEEARRFCLCCCAGSWMM